MFDVLMQQGMSTSGFKIKKMHIIQGTFFRQKSNFAAKMSEGSLLKTSAMEDARVGVFDRFFDIFPACQRG